MTNTSIPKRIPAACRYIPIFWTCITLGAVAATAYAELDGVECSGDLACQVVAVAAVLLAIGYVVFVLIVSLRRDDGEPTRYWPLVGIATGMFVVTSSVLLRAVNDPRPAYLLRWNAAPVWSAIVFAAALLALAMHEARQSRWLRRTERGQTSTYRVADRSSVATETLEPLFGHAPRTCALLLVEHEAYRRPPVVLGAVPSSAALARRSFFVSIQAIAIVLGTLWAQSTERRAPFELVELHRDDSRIVQLVAGHRNRDTPYQVCAVWSDGQAKCVDLRTTSVFAPLELDLPVAAVAADWVLTREDEVFEQGAAAPRLSGVTQLSSPSSSKVCALMRLGTVQCLESNHTRTACRADGLTLGLVPELNDVLQLASTQDTEDVVCALRRTGAVRCWSFCSPDHAIDVGQPRLAVELVAGRDHLCARLESGRVQCNFRDVKTGRWQSNWRDIDGIDDASNLFAGEDDTCALSSGNVARCWGVNAAGELGGSSSRVLSSAQPVLFPLPAERVAFGPGRLFATDGHRIMYWGPRLTQPRWR